MRLGVDNTISSSKHSTTKFTAGSNSFNKEWDSVLTIQHHPRNIQQLKKLISDGWKQFFQKRKSVQIDNQKSSLKNHFTIRCTVESNSSYKEQFFDNLPQNDSLTKTAKVENNSLIKGLLEPAHSCNEQ